MKYHDILWHEEKGIVYLVNLRNASRCARDFLVQENFEHVTNFKTINPLAKEVPYEKLRKLDSFFCNIRHPKERIVRGLAAAVVSSSTLAEQFLSLNLDASSKTVNGYFESNPVAWLKIFHDWHVYPVSYHYEEFLDKLFPLPLNENYELDNTVRPYLKTKGLEIRRIEQRHATGSIMKQIQDKFREIINSEQGNKFYKEFLAPWYQKDLELYHRSLENIREIHDKT